ARPLDEPAPTAGSARTIEALRGGNRPLRSLQRIRGGDMENWNFRKAIVSREEMPEHHRLKQTLSWPHLVALGVGAIVGTGILTLIGVGAGKAGPAVILSFAIAGVICACASLAYAEV